MQRFSQETIARLEEKLGIPWIGNVAPESFANKKHFMWIHPDFDWNPIPIQRVIDCIDLKEEIDRVAKSILHDLDELPKDAFSRQLSEKLCKLDYLFGRKHFQVRKQTEVLRSVYTDIKKVIDTAHRLFTFARRIEILNQINNNSDAYLSIGISRTSNTVFLESLLRSTNHAICNFYITATEQNSSIFQAVYGDSQAYTKQAEVIHTIHQHNPQINLMGMYADQCVYTALGELYKKWQVNVLYDACFPKDASTHKKFRGYNIPSNVVKLVEEAQAAPNLQQKVHVITTQGSKYFNQNCRYLFCTHFLEDHAGFSELENYIDNIRVVHSNRILTPRPAQ